jgi:hypothetical protein
MNMAMSASHLQKSQGKGKPVNMAPWTHGSCAALFAWTAGVCR